LENFFVESSFIEQIYVHGDVAKSFLLAVVIPNLEVAEQWCKLHGKEFDSENICKDTSFSEEIHKDIVRIGAKNRVR
jgi:long-chain acyl-CoA synthetase